MAFDIVGAKRAGFSDSEIAQEMAGKYGFNYGGARESGFSDQEIIGEMLSKSDAGVATPARANGRAPWDATGVSFRNEPQPKKPVDARKVSYTDSGYTPNKRAETPKEFAKNLVQDVVEAPLFPVNALRDVANSPNTLSTLAELGKGLVKTPLSFVPFVAEPVTGKTATENWLTNPGVGAMLAGGAASLGKSGYNALPRTLVDVAPKVENAVRTGIEKGIRPGSENNRTAGQQKSYMGKAQEAVKTIIDNKDRLALTDDFGEVSPSTLPKNLKQFGQAIEQTKGDIFRQYNDMATAAGAEGAKVELTPIARELGTVANSKVLQKVSPEVANYAATRAEALAGDAFTAVEAQEAIAALNRSLDTFYKSPNYESASKAYIDSLVVNNLRKSLDDVIEQSQGPGYQELKRAYGALKTIEKDVNHRALIDARRNVKGLIDFSDIFSGSQVVGGLVNMSPATVGAGVTAKIISSLYKLKNDPNRIVSGMFNKVEKLQNQPPKSKLDWQRMRGDVKGKLQDETGLFAPFGGDIRKGALADKAKQHFGITQNPNETGYILPTGERLDLSGRHYGTGYENRNGKYVPKQGQPDYLKNQRAVDHRELDELVDIGGTDGMFQFMEQSGAIRYMPNVGVTISKLPTSQQIQQFVRDFRASGETLYVDIVNPKNGETIIEQGFKRPTVDAVTKFISEYLKE